MCGATLLGRMALAGQSSGHNQWSVKTDLQDDLRLSHGRELAAAAQLHKQEGEGVRGLLRHAEEEQRRLQDEIRDVKSELEVQRKQMQVAFVACTDLVKSRVY